VADIDQVWDRVERWLERFAPRWRAMLGPPATSAELIAVRQTIGTRLSPDLGGWWRRANGIRHSDAGTPPGSLIPGFFDPYSTDRAIETWRMYLAIQRDVYPIDQHEEMDRYIAHLMSQPAGTNPSDWIWLPAWVPVATNGGGDALFVDLREGPLRGCVTRFHKDAGSVPDPQWPSLAAMW
jgi:cell wall assembly regulator SMI1